MTSETFFDSLLEHFNNALPFVAYRKPNNSIVNGLLQNDDTVHDVDDFSESGFVFAPFNDKEKSILIPFNTSETIRMDYVVLKDRETSHQKIKYAEEDKLKHIKLVKKGIDAISDNVFQKVVLSRCEVVSLREANPVTIFKRLLDAYPTAFVYCWYHPKVGLWLGATPETLIHVEANRYKTMALAGTQQYKGSLEVVWQDKEKQEQEYVTNLIVDNLKASVENINISKPMTVRADNVVHLKTTISGVLKSNLQHILKILHPTAAVCGLPKKPAKEFILNEENYTREFYTGFLGELNINNKRNRNTNRQNVENSAYASIKRETYLFVNLRCMQIKDAKALIYVGGGITKDSIPELEWVETINKGLTMKAVLN
jgi:isochorismate synthase